MVVLVALGTIAVGLHYGLQPDARVTTGQVVTSIPAHRQPTLVGSWAEVKPPVPPTLVADAVVPHVPLFSSPGVPFPDGKALDNPTWEKLPLVFEVINDQRAWLQVRVSMRPNGTVAWIRALDVHTRLVPNRVRIELSAHRVTVTHGYQVLLDELAVIGTPDAPTPVGQFFVDGIVDTHDPGGVWGPFQVSVSGFSDTLTDFGGGVGQIAIHGTNQPELRGTAASHGCVRLSNDAIQRMAWLAPTGTPVDIVA